MTAMPAAVPSPAERGPIALARGIAGAERRYRRSVVVWVACCTAVAGLVAVNSPPTYTAAATLLLPPAPRALSKEPTVAEVERLDDSRADSDLQVIRSGTLLRKVFDSLDLAREPDIVDPPLQPGDRLRALLRKVMSADARRDLTSDERRQLAVMAFASRVGAQRVGFSYVVEVTFTASDPALARRCANAVASAYVWQQLALKAGAAAAGAEIVRPRIVALEAQASAAEAAIAAAVPLPSGALPDADVRLVDPAGPARKTGPRTGIALAFGAVVGLLGGVSAAMADRTWGRRVRTASDLSRAAFLPCLGEVPLGTKPPRGVPGAEWGRLLAARTASPFAMAIRHLRITVRRSPPATGDRVLALVAWTASPAVGALAGALAAVGRDDGGPLSLVEAEDLSRVDGAGKPSRGGPADPLRPLDEAAILAALAEARRTGAVVLALPPLRMHREAAALAAAAADGVVLVADAGATTVDDVSAACRSLRQNGARLLGTVLVTVG